MPRIIFSGGRKGLLQKTLQTTIYHTGDNGDGDYGVTPAYSVLTAGQYSGTTNVDNPHYAAATLAFVSATKKITDSANGLATVLTGDTIRVRGSASNDGVYTVATGGVAGEIVVTEALVNESAGAYLTLCKRASPSNNVVIDQNTGLMYRRYTTKAEKVGAASVGKLAWYDATKCYTIHAAAADLSMTSTTKTLKIVGGAAEITKFWAGQLIEMAGFANAGNNRSGGYRVVSATVNGSDLDIVLWTGFSTTNPLTTEAAGGSRSIKVVCQSIFSYVAAMNAVSFAGYTDWRIPDDMRLRELSDMEAPTAAPDATAFPSWPTDDYIWSGTTLPTNTSHALLVHFANGTVGSVTKVTTYYCALLRGGA